MKLNITFGVLILAALTMIFFYAPIEKDQGAVQKIFYFHVACAITMYLGFFISFLTSILYLFTRKILWDELAISSTEVGYFLCTIVLLTGPVWAKPIWGTWWTWEPRLTTTFLVWLMYSAYLVLRGYFGGESSGKRITAVIAIVDALVVPLIHFSVQLWRGIHPSVMGPQGGGIPPKMQQTLLVTSFAVLLLFVALMATRFRLERSRNLLTFMKLHQEELR